MWFGLGFFQKTKKAVYACSPTADIEPAHSLPPRAFRNQCYIAGGPSIRTAFSTLEKQTGECDSNGTKQS